MTVKMSPLQNLMAPDPWGRPVVQRQGWSASPRGHLEKRYVAGHDVFGCTTFAIWAVSVTWGFGGNDGVGCLCSEPPLKPPEVGLRGRGCCTEGTQASSQGSPSGEGCDWPLPLRASRVVRGEALPCHTVDGQLASREP